RAPSRTGIPSAEQVAALATMQEQVAAYERGASEYRQTLTWIVKAHYESKKKAILSGLDQELVIEKRELSKARDNAIRRLEEFVEGHPKLATPGRELPDAMFKLAALYEERARSEEESAQANRSLEGAIRLYKRITREYPSYPEIAAIYYYLGHALAD